MTALRSEIPDNVSCPSAARKRTARSGPPWYSVVFDLNEKTSVMRFSKYVLAVVGVPMAAVCMPAVGACQPGAAQYDFLAQRLDQALQQFAHTSGCMVHVETQQLGDKKASALSGRYTPAVALVRLVRGSGMEVHVDMDRYAVNHADQTAIEKRIHALREAIATAENNSRVNAAQAKDMRAALDGVQHEVPMLIRQQGFLSAAEKASYDRLFVHMQGRLAGIAP